MKKVLCLLILFHSTWAFSYPIFYSCQNEKMIAKDKIDDDDFFSKFLAKGKVEREELVDSWCKGSKECMKDFNNLLVFAKVEADIAKTLFLEELKKMTSKIEGSNIESLSPLDFAKFQNGYASLRACQEAKAKLNPEDFVLKGDEKVITPYPFLSDYSYAGFCPQWVSEEYYKGEGYCSPIDKHSLDRIIKEAVVMEVDPNLIIALSLMEGGTGEVGSLYLDPIGVMGAMGCSAKQVSNNSTSNLALDSYGTKYIVNADIKKDKKLKEKLNRFYDAFSIKKEEGNSFYCYDVVGKGGDPKLFETPQKNSCCLELGFKAEKGSAQDVSHALTYHFVEKIMKSKFKNESDPAFRIQRYNGYTDLMGAAEGVSPWRAGVNYFKTPAYGYQAMDFILNSLMFNPYVQSKIEEEEAKYDGKESKSVLCLDKKNGTYMLDSDTYYEKHKKAERLAKIHEKYQKGVSYNSLSSREKNVMSSELADSSNLNSKMHNTLSSTQREKLESNLMEELGYPNEVIAESYIDKSTWLNKVKGKSKLTSSELNKIYDGLTQADVINAENTKISNDYWEVYAPLVTKFGKDEKASALMDLISDESEDYMNPFSQTLLAEAKKAGYEAEVKSLNEIRLNYTQNENKLEKIYDGFTVIDNHESEATLEMITSLMKQPKPIEDVFKEYEDKISEKPELKEKIELIYNDVIANKQKVNYNEAFKEYMKTIYSERNTIGESSSFPWRRLSSEEVEKIAKEYDGYR